MIFDFYLSEMSVSNKHGGGLTLQRILGEDLRQIDYFFHASRFADDMPVINELKSKCVNVSPVTESNLFRNLLGCTLAYKITHTKFILNVHAFWSAKRIRSVFNNKSVLRGFICPQSIISILILEKIKRKQKVNYITWVMDDHLVKWENNNWVYKKFFKKLLYKHLSEADRVIVISDVMKGFYKKQFNINSVVLFGSADTINTPIVQKNETRGILKIGYFGGVSGWQLDAMQALTKMLNLVNAELFIYSASIQKLPESLNEENVYLESQISPDQVQNRMQNYDVILLPISFKEEYRNLSEFNIATKMSECLSSGIPVLAIGPEYSAMIKYLREGDLAFILTSLSKEDFISVFKKIRNKNITENVLLNAKRNVEEYLNTNSMRSVWKEIMNLF